MGRDNMEKGEIKKAKHSFDKKAKPKRMIDENSKKKNSNNAIKKSSTNYKKNKKTRDQYSSVFDPVFVRSGVLRTARTRSRSQKRSESYRSYGAFCKRNTGRRRNNNAKSGQGA